jgi:hypothetical protein
MFRKITESNSLLLPLIFFPQRHAEARKEDRGEYYVDYLFCAAK